jgi:hypothetical protein
MGTLPKIDATLLTLAETKDDEAKSGSQPPSSSQPEPNVTPAEEYLGLEDRLEAENERDGLGR